MKYDYLNLPLQILEFMVSSNHVHEIRLWLYLKFISRGGHIKLEERSVEVQSMVFLGIKTKRTYHKRLKWLIKYGYITCNSKTKNYRLISMNTVARRTYSRNYIGAIVYLEDLSYLKEFAFAAVASNLVRRSLREERRSGSKLGKSRTRKSRSPSERAYYQLPNALFQKIFKVSTSTVSRLKRDAKLAGYIEIEKVFYKLAIPPAEVDLLRKYGPYDPSRIVIYNDRVVWQEPDLISSIIVTRVNYALKKLGGN